jgi:F0F1-type ATP synthase alpha subunit
VKPFEHDLYAFFDAYHAELLDQIRRQRELSDDLRKRLLEALNAFMQTFTQAETARPAESVRRAA